MIPESHPTIPTRTVSSRAMTQMDPELRDWMEYLKWKCERSERRLSAGAPYIVAGVAVLSLVLSAVFAFGVDYILETDLRISLLAAGILIGGGVGLYGLFYPATSQYGVSEIEGLIDLIMRKQITTVQHLLEKLEELREEEE